MSLLVMMENAYLFQNGDMNDIEAGLEVVHSVFFLKTNFELND